MTYAEIAAARPKYGGEYAFLREAYGDLAGFLYMWTQITVAKPASLATIAAGLARVLATFAVFSSFERPAFAHLLWGQIFALAVTWLITILNILGTRNSANVQLVLTWLKGVLILVIAGFCFGRFVALGLALIVEFFSARQRQLALDPALFHVDLGRYQRQASFPCLALQLFNLAAMQQQLAGPNRLVIGAIAVRIRR